MNRTQLLGVASFIPRLCLALALVYMICHIDVLFPAAPAVDEPRPDDMRGLTSLVENPLDASVEALTSFIRIRYRTSTSVAFSATVASVQASKETGLPATLFLAVAGIESGFRPHADNGVDKGIMQINPLYHPEKVARIGGAANLFKVGLGIKTGARILKEYSDRQKGDIVQTLLRYNGASALNDYPRKVLSEKRRLDAVLTRKTSA